MTARLLRLMQRPAFRATHGWLAQSLISVQSCLMGRPDPLTRRPRRWCHLEQITVSADQLKMIRQFVKSERVATDTLSDVLKTVRLTGAAYFDVAAREPWSLNSPARD
jgi:hypothetical protein